MAIVATEQNFKQSVLDESHKRPVLVDFWAEWCGPCRMLGPVLDKLEADYGGRFVLAKLDTDKNQSIAGNYQISGIPAVKLFVGGEVVDEFVGALPEPSVRAFLERNVPDPQSEALKDLSESDPIGAADQILKDGIQNKTSEEVLWNGVLAGIEKEIDVRTYLDAIPEIGSTYSDPRNWLLAYLDTKPDTTELKQIVQVDDEAESRKFLDLIIERIQQSDSDGKNRWKQAMFIMFFIMGTTNPLVLEYRRKLSSILF